VPPVFSSPNPDSIHGIPNPPILSILPSNSPDSIDCPTELRPPVLPAAAMLFHEAEFNKVKA
jgi:hypothetical protein